MPPKKGNPSPASKKESNVKVERTNSNVGGGSLNRIPTLPLNALTSSSSMGLHRSGSFKRHDSSELNSIFGHLFKSPSLRSNLSRQDFRNSEGWTEETLVFDLNGQANPLLDHKLFSVNSEVLNEFEASSRRMLEKALPDPCSAPPLHTDIYGFKMTFLQSKAMMLGKTVTSSFSPVLNRLFVTRDTSVPMIFKSSKPIPVNSVLRFTARYTQPEHANAIVIRCPNHTAEATALSSKTPDTCPPFHLLKCDTPLASYATDSVSGRHSFSVPCLLNSAGCLDQTELLRIMCFSSCSGGLNRRPVDLWVTLEANGQVLAREEVNVRVCACPGRDRKQAERASVASVLNDIKTMPVVLPPKKENHEVGKKQTITAICKRTPTDPLDSFVLQVRGLENYAMLTKIADALGGRNGPVSSSSSSISPLPPSPSDAHHHDNPAHPRKKAKKDAQYDDGTDTEGEDAATAPPSSPLETVPSWLQRMGLGSYGDAFVSAGYDDIELLPHLDEKDLDLVGVTNVRHRRRILQAAPKAVDAPTLLRHGLLIDPSLRSKQELMFRVTLTRSTSDTKPRRPPPPLIPLGDLDSPSDSDWPRLAKDDSLGYMGGQGNQTYVEIEDGERPESATEEEVVVCVEVE